MEKVILGGAIVYLDFALLTDIDGQLGVISYSIEVIRRFARLVPL